MKKCTYDNGRTGVREFWHEGQFVGQAPKQMFDDWKANQFIGDSRAKGRMPPEFDLSNMTTLCDKGETTLYATMDSIMASCNLSATAVGRKALTAEVLEWHFAYGKHEAFAAIREALDRNFSSHEIRELFP